MTNIKQVVLLAVVMQMTVMMFDFGFDPKCKKKL